MGYLIRVSLFCDLERCIVITLMYMFVYCGGLWLVILCCFVVSFIVLGLLGWLVMFGWLFVSLLD